MVNHLNTLLYIWRALFVGMLIVASIFVLSFLLSPVEARGMQPKKTDSSLSSSPNVITSGMVKTADGLGKTMGSAALSVNKGMQSTASTFARGGKLVARGMLIGVTTVVRGVGSGLAFTGRAIGKGVGFVVSIPGNAVEAVSDTSVTNAVIRPSDYVEVPIIDPNSPDLQAAIAALPPAKNTPGPAAPANNPGPRWPIQGRVTTEFGVGHWPYQRTHTGMDISDQRVPGTTPVKPFRPGRVIETIRSTQGLGNHVIVDHGNGVTSVYAHLHSISVQVGQEVGLDTVLGMEGTTGVSTGTHLHFEIRVNGQAANPRQFIPGNP